MDKDLHKGHRMRMKMRFMENMSFDGFSEHEVLEMLLFYCYARRDTNEIAHKLIEEFGSLDGVLSASPRDLAASGYVGENPAVTLKIFYALNSYLMSHKGQDKIDCSDIDMLSDYIARCFAGRTRETLMMFFADNSLMMKKYVIVGEGRVSEVTADLREISRIAVNSGCEYLFLAHNHPDGACRPSAEDVVATKRILRHLADMKITLLDHYIVGKDGARSMREMGLIYDYE